MSITDRISIQPNGTISIGLDAGGDGVLEWAPLATTADASASASAAAAAVAPAALSVLATADGLTTGTVVWPVGAVSVFANVTSANANHIVVIPVGSTTDGSVIRLVNGATGYELRSEDPATVPINGGTGVDAESAIGANVMVTCVNAHGVWLCENTATNGAVTATQVAAP